MARGLTQKPDPLLQEKRRHVYKLFNFSKADLLDNLSLVAQLEDILSQKPGY